MTNDEANWTTADIPRQTGRLAVITDATGGLGFETALALVGAVAARLWDVSEGLTNVRWPSAIMEHAS
jgi:hypothetical protein